MGDLVLYWHLCRLRFFYALSWSKVSLKPSTQSQIFSSQSEQLPPEYRQLMSSMQFCVTSFVAVLPLVNETLKIVQITRSGDENEKEDLHARMSIKELPKSAINGRQQIASNFLNEGGVLAFVYSMVLTRGLDQVQSDMGLQMDPLIESVHAHGSVALTNLCITGRAVPNLFDDSRDLGGLVLQGINETPDIGYLSLMEHYRYIEVGERMKNPRYPIWLLSSETHLTVLCSLEKSLCAASEEANLKRAFAKFDTEGNGFIQETQLPDLMHELGEANDHESVLRVKSELDSEDLGIITLGAVMQKYLPESAQLTLQSITGQPVAQGQEFQVMTDIPFIHYNGLHFKRNTSSSNSKDDDPAVEKKVQSLEHSFSYGIGIIGLDAGRLAGAAGVKESKLDLILSTKWPAINISWSLGPQPSVDWSS
ncbi:ubiquitin carboxyl-terminal hydrolase MINDY-3-like isoform X2 [Convolutriloba macropyga]|uniref:ubiquitin carboxyl-terminal hydrolase MINDY-3-like isoform X2 n=1 Tax=Convolutriloba macropyga TaxID=536237 RepID=UPI003F5237E6